MLPLVLVGGIFDTVFSRIIDVLLAVPFLILALAIVGVLGVGFENLLIALVVSFLAFLKYVLIFDQHFSIGFKSGE